MTKIDILVLNNETLQVGLDANPDIKLLINNHGMTPIPLGTYRKEKDGSWVGAEKTYTPKGLATQVLDSLQIETQEVQL